jgi:hypothetical protein
MLICRDVNELELKQKDSRDPTIDRRVRLQVGIIDHTLHVLGVDLDSEVGDTKNPNANCTKRAKETI